MMSAETPETVPGKTRKRAAAKTATRPTASKVKATIHISTEAHQRLSVHAAMLGMDRSELIESLLNTHLKRFVVSDRGGGSEFGNGGREEPLSS